MEAPCTKNPLQSFHFLSQNASIPLDTNYKLMAKNYVYIMTCSSQAALYIGVTSDISKRLEEHKEGKYEGFTKKYNLHKLVYFEEHSEMYKAIKREKQLKWWKRSWKEELINSINPEWLDLSDRVNQNEE